MSNKNFSDVIVSSSMTVFSVSLSELSFSGPISKNRTCPLLVGVRLCNEFVSESELGGGCGLPDPSCMGDVATFLCTAIFRPSSCNAQPKIKLSL